MNIIFLDNQSNPRNPETWAEVKESICASWDSCSPCTYAGGMSRTGGGFECRHPLRPIPYRPLEPNTVIAQLKKELAEGRECELTARQLGHSIERWEGYQSGLRRAIKIVEKMK